MSGNRGEFRSISVVLLDGPDFRRLRERERTTLLVARLSLGPCGIDAVPAFLHVLSERTGMSIEEQRTAWAGLQDAGWVYYDGLVAWVVRGLDFEPGRDITDWKHRKNVQSFIMALPRTALVGSFVERYRNWWVDQDGAAVPSPEFPEPDETLTAWISQSDASRKALRRGFEAPADKGKGKGEGKKEGKGEEEAASSARAKPVGDFLEEVRTALPAYADRFTSSLKAAHDPTALVSEFRALLSGMHGPGGKAIPLHVIGQALADIATNGDQLTARRLRVFCNDLMKTPKPEPTTNAGDELAEFERRHANAS